MREPTFLELKELAKELQGCIGMRVDQFYELSENRFRIKAGLRGAKINIQIELPHYIAETGSPEVREDATGFAIAVRKRIDNAEILKIEMYNNDRIVRIVLGRGGEALSMILEMFGRGNIAITDHVGKILLAYRPHAFSDRSVKPGETYEQPKSDAPDLSNADTLMKYVGALIESGKGRIGKALRQTGIGGLYLEEAMARARIDPSAKVSDMAKSTESADALKNAIVGMVGECGSGKGGYVYLSNGMPADYSMVRISKYAGMETKEYARLSEAMEEYYRAVKSGAATEHDKNVESLRASIEKQRELINETIKEEERCRNAANAITANAAAVREAIKAAADKGASEADIERASHVKVKRIDRKERTITVEI